MKAKRLLAVLLSIVMTLSVLPAAAFAADRSAAAEEPMRVFHLDCGRKYFTAEQIKSLIDEMAQDGYNYMELAVGNDGLRFLLDDLSLDYSVETAVAEEALPDDLLTTLDPEVVPPEEIETPQPEETETPKPEEPEAPKPEPETPVEKVDPPVTEEVPPATEQKPPVTEAETPVTEEDSSSAEAETTAEEGILTGELTLAAREENVMSSITHSVKRSFSHEVVEAAIKAGNEAYTTASSGELTKGEMDGIIAYAKKNGISIIPLVNSPGHMDAILTAAQTLTGASGLAYKGSKTTIDVTNAEAVAFTKALLQKYIDYFADKGCQYFNMGADEYANDKFTSGGMGFGNLVSNSKSYEAFINYINAVAKMITTAGMTPIAFNDGIRYNGQEPVTIDRDIIVSYWSSGWPGYDVASAADLASAGFQILNTNGDWYYVLKTGAAGIDGVKKQIRKTPWTSVMDSTVEQSKLVGAMVCLWCDDPGFTYSEGNAKEQIKVFAESNSDLFTVKPVVKDLPFMVETADGTESEPLTKAGLDITRGEAQTLTYTGEGTIEANAANDTDVFSVEVNENRITVTAMERGTGILHVEVTADAPMTRAYAETTGTEYDIPITVAAETDSLEAEFWCTNTRVTGVGVNANKTAISFAGNNKPVIIANSVPKAGKSGSRTYVYWKSVRLPDGEHQTSTNGVDKTHSGTEIIAVMYDGTDYYYYSKADPNTAEQIKPTDQLVSYYKQVFVKLENNHAVITGADWGNEEYIHWAPKSVTYTIKEMDGNGAELASASKTMWYGVNGQIKDIGAPVAAGYEVYKVTEKNGDSTTSARSQT